MITLIDDHDEPIIEERPTLVPPKKEDNTLLMTITLLCVGLLITAIIAYLKNKDKND